MEYDKQMHQKGWKTKKDLTGRLNQFEENINKSQSPTSNIINSIPKYRSFSECHGWIISLTDRLYFTWCYSSTFHMTLVGTSASFQCRKAQFSIAFLAKVFQKMFSSFRTESSIQNACMISLIYVMSCSAFPFPKDRFSSFSVLSLIGSNALLSIAISQLVGHSLFRLLIVRSSVTHRQNQQSDGDFFLFEWKII